MIEDLRLVDGGLDSEREIPAHPEIPTWIVNKAFDKVKEVAINALDAYMYYCKKNNIPHSYLLGLDILITGIPSEDGNYVTDIRPTILEGPCCNSYPACPNIDAYKLYMRTKNLGKEPDKVKYPIHPTEIRNKIIETFEGIWNKKTNSNEKPNVAILTRAYKESEEETAHNLILNGLIEKGFKAFRITPEEKPEVKNGKLYVKGYPIDICYRRIERIHVPIFYGEILAKKIIEEAVNTIFVNPWQVDDLRSKVIEEKCFREWEKQSDRKISRPITLLDEEITTDSLKKLLETSGIALKRWNSTGGKGVFLNFYLPRVEKICDVLYKRYDGIHVNLLKDDKDVELCLKEAKEAKENSAIQQLRLIDSRKLGADNRLVYDTRINVLYNPKEDKWNFLSGFSRCVPCGQDVKKGNSLLTNVTSGAEIATLVMGYTEKINQNMDFGPLLKSLMEEQTDCKII